jgi:adenylate cyclase
MTSSQRSPEELLAEIERLQTELQILKQEKFDLEILLETTTEHSDSVTDQLHQEALAEARRSEKRLAQFLEAVPVGILVIDADKKIYFINRKAQEISLMDAFVTGRNLKELNIVDQIYIAGTDELYPPKKTPIIRALNGENSTVDDMEIRTENKTTPIEVWATPIYDEKGKIIYAIAAFQDITQRKQAETERYKFTEQLFALNKAYERFVPYQFLNFLGKETITEVQLGDQVQKEMSILFCDIRNFTSMSEKMTPQDNFKFINSYLSRMEPIITQHHGMIDKYIGDAIMALFSGTPDQAVKAAINMLQALKLYNYHRHKVGYKPVEIGIGINTGLLMLGTVGTQHRMDGTVISDAVNLASRVEQLTKEYGVSLLISQHTFSRLQDANEYAIRLIDHVVVKGKSESISIFEIFDADPEDIKQIKFETKTKFEKGLLFYNLHNYAESKQIFKECLKMNPQDKPAQIYIKRCEEKLKF